MNDNPASRLLSLIRKADGLLMPKKSGVPPLLAARKVFADILGVGEGSPHLLRRIGLMAELPFLVQTRIKSKCGQDGAAKYLRWLENVNGRFRELNLSAPARSFFLKIGRDERDQIGICSDVLGQDSEFLNEESLDGIHADVSTLLDDVAKADIGGDLKGFLLDKLDLIRQAIEERGITGAAPILHVIEGTVGAVCLRPAVLGESAKTGVVRKFLAILANLLVAVELLNGVAQLPESVRKLLPQQAHKATSEVVQDAEIIGESTGAQP
ncbi:MAG: hypothetical protein EOM68_30240 [Spirochaetia bacterium]|nr:hypothetical protein [Spirochaetia bacterium]